MAGKTSAATALVAALITICGFRTEATLAVTSLETLVEGLQ